MPVNVQFAAYIFVFSIQLTAKILSMELFELGPSGVGSDRSALDSNPRPIGHEPATGSPSQGLGYILFTSLFCSNCWKLYILVSPLDLRWLQSY